MGKQVEKLTVPGMNMPRKKRVAAYARVSSGKDAMLHSLSAQVSAYSAMIQKTPGWQFVKVYADESVTGTKDSRAGFQQMLVDCRAGLIDMVLCKSISRLARNTVTLLETVRELKELGVDVYFEEQNIHTLSAEGELMLTILASYAQEESRSVSENMHWRVKKNFEEGLPWGGNRLGYRFRNGRLIVQPDEAETVRRIYREFLSGKGVDAIANGLNADGITTIWGYEWRNNGVLSILRNYYYTGKIVCGDCGAVYGSKVWHSKDQYRRVIWQCNGKYAGEHKCSTPHLTEEQIQDAFCRAIGQMLTDRDRIIGDLEAVKLGFCDETDLAEKQEKLLAEMDVLESLMRKAVTENAENEQDQEAYAKRYDGYVVKYEKLKKRYSDMQAERLVRRNKAQILDGMIEGLRCAEQVSIGFDEKLWTTTVDHVTIHRDDSLVFTMRDGREIRVKK